MSLRKNWQENKHNKILITHKVAHLKQNMKKRAFLGWEKQYKAWKIIKNKEDFDKAVKLEL